MKKIIFAATLLFGLGTCVHAADFPKDLTGKYECDSIEVGTKEHYTGKLTLTKTGDTYSSKSVYNDGSTYFGTSIYDPATHILVAAFINPKNKKETGVAMITVAKDSTMKSTWTYLNKTTLGSGTCVKVG